MAAHAHEPSSSSSSCTSRTDCDAFLSFSGKDTYKNFTGHLHYALDNAGIVTFVANTDLEGGDTLWPALEKAITRSRIFIPIFSKNYSSSKWCLDELVKSRETKDQIVLPIFFDVDPCDVRTQGGDFGQQFQQLAKSSDKVTVERWKKALEEAGFCRGHNLRNEFNGNQLELIQRVVKYVNHKLEETSSGVSENLVGIDSVVEELLKLLNLASKGVEMVGIWGMGGIGKTTAAQAVFDQIRHQFECCIFLEDIREASKQFNGLVGLQRDLLRGILNQEFKFLGSSTQRKSLIINHLKTKKVLIVLDDVNEVEQLDALAGNVNWFNKGSRIIVTTQDKSVLMRHQIHRIYEIKELDSIQSLELFCMHAFKNNLNPPDFMDLAKQAAHSAGGLPLVLKVLGSFLSFETNREEWKCTLGSLINIPLDEVRSRLRISYDGLPFWYKEIFLDISCFFIPINMEDAASILHSDAYSVTSVIKGLAQRSLVKIDSFNRLKMHDQLRDMGRDVVYRESPNEPGKRSRLWLKKDVLNVLKEHEGTESVKGLVLKFEDETASAGMQFKTKAFAPMSKIRLLQIDYVRLVGNFQKKILSNLRWLSWKGCPLVSIPTNFDLKKLVVLDLSYSRIERVLKGQHKKQMFHELKVLKLSGCQHLTKTPKFSRLPNLEELNLEGCIGLRKIPNSICNLKSFKKLILSGCSNLNELPDLCGSLQGLELLKLDGCKLLSGLDWISYMKNLKEITLDGTSITELPDAFGLLENMKELSLNHCSNLVKLPNSMGRMRLLEYIYIDGTSIVKFPEDFGMLSSLTVLSMENCRELRDFPDNFGKLCSLRQLVANGCNFCSLPAISDLSLLWMLDLNNCRNLQYLPEIPSSVGIVNLNNCISLEKISALSGLKKVFSLKLSNCKKLAKIQGIENMEGMKYLWMNGCSRTLVNCVNNGLSPGFLQSLMFWSFPGNQIPDFFTPLKVRYASGLFGDKIILDFEEVRTGLWNPEQHQKIAGLLLCLVLKNTAVRMPFYLQIYSTLNGRRLLFVDQIISVFNPSKRHEDQIFFYRFDWKRSIRTLEEGNGISFDIEPRPDDGKDDMDSVWEEGKHWGRVIEVKKAAMYVLYREMEQSIFNRTEDFITHWSYDDVVDGGEPSNRKRKFLQLFNDEDDDDDDGGGCVPSNSKTKISPTA